MIKGYFNNDPPSAFFNMLSYYYTCDALSALCYSFLGMEQCEPEDGKRHMENVLRWFDNMENSIPYTISVGIRAFFILLICDNEARRSR